MKIAIVGCGIVGAMIAYELSQVSGLQITVLDRQPPAQASTGAALGVLMGVISQKTKGRAWTMRQASIRRYAELLPRLEGMSWNAQGIVRLCFPEDDLAKWQTLIELRQQQGWRLEFWSPAELQDRCPQVQHPDVTGAIYSPQDYQVDPTALTLALVRAARQQGVDFRFNVGVERLTQLGSIKRLELGEAGNLEADWVVIAAGLGSTPLLAASTAASPLRLVPVLGQALRIQLATALGQTTFQPVITGRDVHIVPLLAAQQVPSQNANQETGQNISHDALEPGQHYWVGATVEFAPESALAPTEEPLPLAERLETVWQDAVGLCPALATATRLQSWSGLRPRPQNRPAPVVEPLPGYDAVWLATGHYRNGVLLAPATAQLVRAAVEGQGRFS